MYPSQQAERFNIRLPAGVRDRLKEVAAENRRSMNSELVVIIEKALFSQSPETQNGSVTA